MLPPFLVKNGLGVSVMHKSVHECVSYSIVVVTHAVYKHMFTYGAPAYSLVYNQRLSAAYSIQPFLP